MRVKIPAKETEFPERNDALLREIADKTGGDYFVGMAAAVGAKAAAGRAGLATAIKPQDQVTILPGTPDRQFRTTIDGLAAGADLRRVCAWSGCCGG